MVRSLARYDSVALAGSLIGLSSYFVGWLTLKPSRLAAGASLNVWEIAGWGSSVIPILWLACLVIALMAKRRKAAVALGITVNVCLIITFLLAGRTASEVLQAQPSPFRVSLGAGIWLSIAAAYVIVFSVRQTLRDMPLVQTFISLVAIVVLVVFFMTGLFNDLSLVQEFDGRRERFAAELLQHILLFGVSVGIGAAIGIPLGAWATTSKRLKTWLFNVGNITQTIPSLALFGFLIAPLSALSLAVPALRELGVRGVGATPALIALTIYSLLPIMRNTYAGLRQVSPAAVNAGIGVGMSRSQLFFKVETPLATPIILAGIRIASVQAVGNAAVAALIGAGGLGFFIFEGLGQAAADLIILGSIPIIGLALVVDVLMAVLVKLATPKGVREGQR